MKFLLLNFGGVCERNFPVYQPLLWLNLVNVRHTHILWYVTHSGFSKIKVMLHNSFVPMVIAAFIDITLSLRHVLRVHAQTIVIILSLTVAAPAANNKTETVVCTLHIAHIKTLIKWQIIMNAISCNYVTTRAKQVVWEQHQRIRSKRGCGGSG